jgi:predicted dehydrogenase
MGLIGGGPGSFIGPIHRLAAEMDREIELVAGAFSSSAEKSRIAGEDYRIDPARAYPDIATMIAQEAAREDGIDFVAITTPNHMHLPAAKAALEAGLAVICDKPATTTLSEAHELAAIVEASGKPFALTYTYSGYPLVREARARIAAGALGPIRKVVVEYPQGWLAKPDTGKQAQWRGDPHDQALADAWRTSASMRSIWPNSSPACASHRFSPTLARWFPDDWWMTIARSCCALTMARAGPCWPARFRWVNATA